MGFDFKNIPNPGDVSNGYTWDGEKWTMGAGTNAPASGALPKLWGTAAPGVATPYSREDHVHPVDENALAYSGMQINGSFDVSQEKGVTPTVVNNQYICDGWKSAWNTATAQPGALATPSTTIFPSFINMLQISTSVAQASLTNEYAAVINVIEGYRIARLAWGTAGAQPLTIGFWSSHTPAGEYSVSVRNGAPTTNRSYVAPYTQAVAGVAQYNVITIPGDIAGTWASDNTQGMQVMFTWAASGTLATSTPNTWLAGNIVGTTTQINGVNSTANRFRITGVVVLPGIEAPSAARSALIMRSYDQELVTCQRYFQKINPIPSLPAIGLVDSVSVPLPLTVNFRANPTITFPWTNANFNSTPSATTWLLEKPGIASATKTGTATLGAFNGVDHCSVFMYGMTMSSTTTHISTGASLSPITLDARL